VTHPDPYPYYAELVATRPLYRDESLGLWVAAGADAVTSVLSSDICRVRPRTEPVPRALLGSPAADIFRHLVRMNDGAGHGPLKQAVSSTLGSIDAAQAAEQSVRWARWLSGELRPHDDLGRLTDLAFRLPVYVVASLLGIPPDLLPQTAQWMSEFVACLAPASSPEAIERGKVAAGHLLDTCRPLLSVPPARPGASLLAHLAENARRAGREDSDAIVANGIGFLSQAYEATAGLIGNTLRTLAVRPETRQSVATNPRLLHQVIAEVLRCDPPIQNTRRFLAENGRVAGREMATGDAVLVVLAAANRDPSANPDPDRFDIVRKDRRLFTFGIGAHACPGEALATTIAGAGVEELLASGLALDRLAGTVTYRASANARIPLFNEA
jgi:cytochrome P450